MRGFGGNWLLALGAALLIAACAATPTGQGRLQPFSEADMAAIGNQAFQQVERKTPTVEDPALTGYVQCVVNALAAAAPPAGDGPWRVTIFREDTVNGFALPGGHIGVSTGMLDVARTPGQLAAVIAHEIGHLNAGHLDSRLSTEFPARTAAQIRKTLAGGESRQGRQIMSLLGLETQGGAVLPFSRSQESEADVLGLRYMAEAGFDPHEAVQLWRNMMAEGGGGPQGFLSPHPAGETRIHDLEEQMAGAMRIYQQARDRGRNPECGAPP